MFSIFVNRLAHDVEKAGRLITQLLIENLFTLESVIAVTIVVRLWEGILFGISIYGRLGSVLIKVIWRRVVKTFDLRN